MKFFNIIVHGVPYGQDIFSTDPVADESYIKTFYKQQDNPLETLFEIEARKEGNQQLVYYHYLKRRDVLDAEGRAGSYFGFTLRTDVSCDEMALLFHHMDAVFRTRILGSLLERAGNGYRHRVKKYSQGKSVVESMVQEFNAWLSLPGIQPLFHEVPACPQAKSVSQVYNLEDFARYEVVKGALQRGMTMRLSPDVPRNADQQKMAELNRKIATAFAEKERAVEQAKAESRSEMDRMNKSIQEQKTEIDRLNGEINRLNDETDRLNGETDRLKKENARWQEGYKEKADEVQRMKTSRQENVFAYQAEDRQLSSDSQTTPWASRHSFYGETSRRAARSEPITRYAPDDEEERWRRKGVTPTSLLQKLVHFRKFWMVCAGLFLVVIVFGIILVVRPSSEQKKMHDHPVSKKNSGVNSGAQRAGRTTNYSEQPPPTSASSRGDNTSEPQTERNKREESGKAQKQTEAPKVSAAKQSTPSKKKENSATSSPADGKKKASTAGSQSTPSEKKGKSATSSHADGKKKASPAGSQSTPSKKKENSAPSSPADESKKPSAAAKQSTTPEKKTASGADGDKPRK